MLNARGRPRAAGDADAEVAAQEAMVCAEEAMASVEAA